EGQDAAKAVVKLINKADTREKALAMTLRNLPLKWKYLAGGVEVGGAIKTLLGKEETRPGGLSLIAAAKQTKYVADAAKLTAKTETLAVRKAAVAALGELRGAASAKELVKLLRGDLQAEA